MIANKRIGILRGTFDPFHNGHLEFAKLSMRLANLDRIYFLVEPAPIHKQPVSSYNHRVEIVSNAIKSEKELILLDQANLRGPVRKTMPTLRKIFDSHQLVFLMGSDIAKTLPHWLDLKVLLEDNELIVGLRGSNKKDEIEEFIRSLPHQPKDFLVLTVPLPKATSSKIREELNNKLSSSHIAESTRKIVETKRLYE